MDASKASIVSQMPEFLFDVGPWQLLWWQWAALVLLVAVAVFLGWVLGALSRELLARLARHTATTADDLLVARLGRPLSFAWTCLVFLGSLPALGLAPGAEATLRTVA